MMRDMGRKAEKCPTALSNETKISYPSISYDTSEMPELVDFKIGEKVELKQICRVVGINKSWTGKGFRFELEVRSAGLLNPKEASKKAEAMGLDRETYDALMAKRKRG